MRGIILKREEEEAPTCGAVDRVTGAVCNRIEAHTAPHRDDHDWRIVLEFGEEPKRKALLVSNGGSEVR